jgi:hypothetical protein
MKYCIPYIIIFLITTNSYSREHEYHNFLFQFDQSIERQYISLNHELISAGTLVTGSNIAFELNGAIQDYLIERAGSYVQGTYSIIARGGESGLDHLLVTFEEDRMVGSIVTHDTFGHYHIRYDQNRNRTYLEIVDPSKLDHLECSVYGEEYYRNQHDYRGIYGNSHRGYISPNISALASTFTDIITIDLMIVYTDAAEQWAAGSGFGSINAVIAEAMNLSQFALDNSNVFIELRLVHVYKTDYDETQLDPQSGMTHLRRLTASKDNNPFGDEFDGYMEEVHDLRDHCGADLVALFLSEPGTGGTAWRLTTTLGSPGFGFSINRVQQMGNSYTLIHEIGHNMGNAHCRDQATQQAGLIGGIFEYSTGYRWHGTSGSFATVMSYTEGTYTLIPHFSNPDVMWENEPTGTYFEQYGPSDNARSMREIKAVIANYRLTMVDPPSMTASENSIEVYIDQGTKFSVPLAITNNGDSDLMWSVDFEAVTLDLADGTESVRRDASYETLPVDDLLFDTAGYTGGNAIFKVTGAENTVLLSTQFSAEEGFSVGTYPATRLWRTWTDDMHFEISDENPSVGNKHMRISRQEEINVGKRVESPYFGTQPFGAYEFSMDLSFENMVSGEEYERFQLTIYDVSADVAASVHFANGYIYVRQRIASGDIIYLTRFEPYTIDGYGNLRILTDPDESAIHYFYNDEHIISTEYLTGKEFDFFYLSYYNTLPGTYIDIDNIQLKRIYDPFRWLDLDRYGGVASPGNISDMVLTFTSVGIEPGEYESNMVIRSNDPHTPEIIIPVKLNVSTVIAVEETTDIPREFVLLQNYPNPFNPVTVIAFRLPETERIRLEVYDIVGRRVATLVDDEVSAGEHQITYDVSGLSSGVYIYRITSNAGTLNRKMVVAK